MIHLSPATSRGIFHHLIAQDTPEAAEGKRNRDLARVKEVTLYRCTESQELYDDEDDAVACCAEDAVEGLHDEEQASRCPVCASEFTSPREAADCCLWKDIDAASRWRMADQVDAGATWLQVLGVAA